MKRRVLLVSTALVVGMAIPTALPASGAPASGAPADSRPARQQPAPSGWTIHDRGADTVLTWRSTAPIPMSDASVQFWRGRHLLGTATPDARGQRFALEVPAPFAGHAGRLHVTIGGVPVDAAGQRHFGGGAEAPSPVDPGARTGGTSAIDPGQPGPYATATSEYTRPGVQLTGLPRDVEVQGVVVRPLHASGARPLVLFLHGRHTTCYRGGPDGDSSGNWPCRGNWKPIPSYRGYLDAQQLLASQGYVTVSISANGINGQDYRVSDGGAEARSELVRHHLELFDRWSTVGGAPYGSSLVGRVDLDRVMLVGHSRGGEGVNRAAIDSTPGDPWHIDSQVLIGPTAFGRQTAPGVDTEVLLPYCDGDVSDLQGQQYVDQARDLFGTATDPALRSAVLVMGANHNYFNKEWTPNEAVAPAWDDWGGRNGYCGKRSPTRLSATDQRNVGAVYIATAARAFIRDSSDALALIDGSNVRPASIGDAQVTVEALGANRTPLVRFRPKTDVHAVEGTALVCWGYRRSKGQPTCATKLSRWSQPHFLPMYGASDAPPSYALRMQWRHPGARTRVDLPASVDLTQSSSLDLRVAVPPDTSGARFDVVLGDGSGHVARLGTRAVRALPGARGLAKLWAQQVRLPLPHGTAFDLADVEWIRFIGNSRAGHMVVLDGYGRTPGPSTAPRPTLPRVDVDDVTVTEGDGGLHTENVTLHISGTPVGGERMYVETAHYGLGTGPVSAIYRLTAGQSTLSVPVPVSGDTRDDYRIQTTVTVKALSGVITGHYSGTVTIRDDDPRPNVVVDNPSQAVTEGEPLTWVVRLDHRSDRDPGWLVKPVTSTGTELTVADLPDRFRRRHGLQHLPGDTALSETRLRLYASVPTGQLSTEFTLPIRKDHRTEGAETVTLRQTQHPKPPLPVDLTGTVTDPAT